MGICRGTSTSAGKREEKFPEPDLIHLAVRPGPPHVLRHARRTSSPTRLAGGDQPPARAPVDPIALLRRAALQLRTSARTLRRRRRHLSSPRPRQPTSPNRAKLVAIFFHAGSGASPPPRVSVAPGPRSLCSSTAGWSTHFPVGSAHGGIRNTEGVRFGSIWRGLWPVARAPDSLVSGPFFRSSKAGRLSVTPHDLRAAAACRGAPGARHGLQLRPHR